MNRKAVLFGILRGGGRFLAVMKILLALLLVVSAAAAITVDQKNFSAEIGSAASVPTGLLMTDRGFALASASASATSCVVPVVFGPIAGVASNAISSGHMVYTVRVNSTGSVAALTKFNVTFTLGMTPYGPLCIQTAAVPANGQIIDCKFDIGTSALPVSTYTFRVTIQ